MIQTIIEVTMKDGTLTEFPLDNLDEFKRLLGHNIRSIKPKTTDVKTKPEIVSTRKRKPNNPL
jgi:hypothetical protein